ncbi:hypothetical protein V6N12_063099 [Hibiscus sabdariffa]|uniref:Thioredoxin domain-containing protein n=1 Tax=Hibiscus sabdariffa TaxID=183260 RepID=A0ABR2FAT3_9ROSI
MNDVALIEYGKLTGRPFRVFSLVTGRLNPETYQTRSRNVKEFVSSTCSRMLVVLYAPWCRFSQAMEGSYAELAEKLAGLIQS